MNSRTLVGFVLAVDALALAAIAASLTGGLGNQPWMLVLLLGLAVLAGAHPVHIRYLRHEITASHPFVFLALATVGSLAAILVALAGVLGAAAGGRRRPAAIRFAFNLGAVVLSTSAAAGAFRLLGGQPGQSLLALTLPLMAAATAYFLANTGLVAAAITLEKHKAFFATWRISFSWTVTSYITGFTLAIAMLAVVHDLGPWSLILAVPTCWLMIQSYRAQNGKLEPARIRRVS